MSYKKSPVNKLASQEATEILELACQELDTLSRAFDVISRACEEADTEQLQLSDDLFSTPVLH